MSSICMRLLGSVSFSVLATATFPSVSLAQSAAEQPIPPERYQRDERGVDLVTGKFYFSSGEIDIGDTGSGSGLSYSRTQRQNGYDDQYTTGITAEGGYGYRDVVIGDQSDRFRPALGLSVSGTGATLATNSEGYVYTTADGVIYQFSASVASGLVRKSDQRVVRITYPAGRKIEIDYDIRTNVSDCSGCYQYQITRPRSVSSNDGYRLTFSYRFSEQQETLNTSTADRWMTVASVVASNAAEEYCTNSNCFINHPVWRNGRYFQSGNTETRIDASGNESYITRDGAGRISAIQPSGLAANFITISYDEINRVTAFTKAGATWNYSYSGSNTSQTTVMTAPSGLQTVITSNPSLKLLSSVRIGTGGTTQYQYDSIGQLSAIISPEGNRTTYTRDGRGNVTATTMAGKAGGQTVSSYASFPTNCSDTKTCNKPLSTTDVRGAVTNYEYSSSNGQIAKIIFPSAGNGAPRRQQKFDYQQIYAWYKNASGVLAQSASPIWKLVRIIECTTTTECAGGVDEKITEIAYGVAGQPNNLLPTTLTVRNGNSSIVSASTFAYDRYGNIITVDGPLAGSGDVTATRYDRNRRVVGVISAAPNSNGSGLRPAKRTIFDAAGRIERVDIGNVGGLSDNDWAGFSAAQTMNVSFNAKGNKSSESITGGNLYQINDFAYDLDERLRCSARRSGGGSGDACVVMTNGTYPDQVSEVLYGTDGRVATQRQNGIDTVGYRYTGNGRIERMIDPKGNATTFQYDGLDRLIRTTYPDGSYEYRNLAANGDVGSVRQRDAYQVSFVYDLLGRVTNVNLPAGGSNSNLTLGYDLAGHLTSASNGNGQAPWTNSFSSTFDALGRMTSETSNIGGIGPRSTTYQYDNGGNRTRITWSDGFFASYEYRPDGQVQRVRENGSMVLAEFGYDAFGRRNIMSRGNGTSSTYGYDALSRLNGFSHDLAGTDADVTYALTFDNLSRIKSQTRSNDRYVWQGHVAADRNYTSNSLNQYTQIGGGGLGYDARGNLTSDGNGGVSYAYDALNHLTGSSAGAALAYDALGRLTYTAVNGGSVTRFGYAGDRLIAEYDASGNLVRRYVPGPVADETLVSYGPQGREYLYVDQRASVIALAGDGGVATQVLNYDDYGIPGSNYGRRFQYTGQVWLSEIGMSYYKARIYSPTLGRFLQTDPIGYAAGMNLYAYVGGDPINKTDPSGTCEVTIGGTTYIYTRGGSYTNCGASQQELERAVREYNQTTITVTGGSSGYSQGFSSLGFGASTGLRGFPGGGGSGGGILGDAASAIFNGLKKAAKKVVCTVGNVDVGGGVDGYAGVGGSLGGGYKFDIGTGQFGADVYGTVGFGAGIEAGPTVTLSNPGNSIITANLITQVGGGYGVGLVGTRTLIGTSPGSNSLTIGKVGSPIGFINGGAAVGFHTPKLYDIGC